MAGQDGSASPHLVWNVGDTDEQALEKAGHRVVPFSQFRREIIEPRRRRGDRISLDVERGLAAFVDDRRSIAVTGVPLRTLGDLRDLYGFVVEPAFRSGWELCLYTLEPLSRLASQRPADPEFGYPWTLQRLHWICNRYERKPIGGGLPPMTPIEAQLHDAMQRKMLSPRVQYAIERFSADFAFPEHLLTVEADGRQWHDARRDAARDVRLRKLGWSTLRFTGSEIFADADACAAKVALELARRSVALSYSPVEEHLPIRRSWWRRLVDWFRRRGRTEHPPTLAVGTEATEDVEEPGNPVLGTDQRQLEAVRSSDGVVQVIAPAGSGKTAVLVERVVELISRGVPPHRILCTTFNRATRQELKERLAVRECSRASVFTFAALGRHILKSEGLLRENIGQLTYGQLRRLCRDAKDASPDGVWIEAPDASDLIEDLKLGKMVTPSEALAMAQTDAERTAARIYELYERELKASDTNDFADLILNAVRLLQKDREARSKWQKRWWHVLVDEYQDIERSQELLLQLLAAPQDALFVVGDEDQCVYTWRRASVDRIVRLDETYPGLQRVVLTTNYRCPASVVAAARALIQNNRRRFPKEIHSAPSADAGTTTAVTIPGEASAEERSCAVTDVLQSQLDEYGPEDTVVLARTSRMLREAAAACVAGNIPFQASDRVINPSAAERTVRSYLRCLFVVDRATVEDVGRMFGVPNRYLPQDKRQTVLQQLRGGASMVEAIDAMTQLETFRRKALAEGAVLLDRLRTMNSSAVLAALRDEGGLDRHYGDQERMNRHDLIEIEALDELAGLAKTTSDPATLLEALEERDERIRDSRDEGGVELTTIHGAKGRQWGSVILLGADDRQMPHRRAMTEALTDSDLEAVIEDERRLAYVALTRAKDRFTAVYTRGSASRFLGEAGLVDDVAPAEAPLTHRPKHPASRQPGTPTKTAVRKDYCVQCGRNIEPGQRIALPRNWPLWIHDGC